MMGDGWGYTYKSEKMVGIKQTHQPSPWINDYGAFSLMAGIGELKVKEDERKFNDYLLIKGIIIGEAFKNF